jgi:hypothetical protein
MTENQGASDKFFFTHGVDYHKIVSMSDDEFSKYYLEKMSEYKEKDGWWSEGKVPACFDCNEVIQGPKDLRRFYGQCLHADCFKEYYESVKFLESGIRRLYWDRVAALKL